MRLVNVESRCVVSDDDCVRNLYRTLARNLPRCKVSPERTDKIAIVASGPSVEGYLSEIATYPHVWAINGAYNYLLSQGIVPTGFFGTDPLPAMSAYVQNARPETTFYISAICDDALFDALKGQKVEIWFPYQTNVEFPIKLEPDEEFVTGGTTALTRAPFLARSFGFRDVTLYGADSSFNERRYVYQDGTYPEDSKAHVSNVFINGEGPFPTELCLMKQVSQLGVMHTHQTWGVKLDIRCKGLMDAYLRAPLETDAEDDIAKSLPPD